MSRLALKNSENFVHKFGHHEIDPVPGLVEGADVEKLNHAEGGYREFQLVLALPRELDHALAMLVPLLEKGELEDEVGLDQEDQTGADKANDPPRIAS